MQTSNFVYDANFSFEIVKFPFLDGDVPRSPSCGVYFSQLIRFARVCSHVDDFNNRNKYLTSKLLNKVIDHTINSVKLFLNCILIVKYMYNFCLKTLLQQGISEPVFYGDLV